MSKSPSPSLRRLVEADAIAFREIQLEGLRLHPAAFGASFDDENTQSLSFFERRIMENPIFGGYLGDSTLVGVAGLIIPSGAKLRHKGILWGMYVRAAARGIGLARALVDAVLDHARGIVDEIKLEVLPDNESALRLYRDAAFTAYAREPRALKIEGIYYDSLLMTLPFDIRP
jgi:ribosomal protein S18 acetylase RimI-like enzyme